MSPVREKMRLRIYLMIFSAVLVLGTFGFMLAEHLSLADAIYFTVVTIATVGYGDISPASPLGKILAVVLIVAGVGTFVSTLATATELFLNRRDHEARQRKLQMVVGLFFSETGSDLLRYCARADRCPQLLDKALAISNGWATDDFEQAGHNMANHAFEVNPARIDLADLRILLGKQGSMLVRLLESPYLLEHESFTDLLIATLHLKEELQHRQGFDHLPASDLEHLAGDINRVYRLAAHQWLDYVRHLQSSYPFLFSLALRTNPFLTESCPLVREP
jgi:hypothetical protein